LSERNGLQAPHPPAFVTVEAPLAADIVGCLGERVNDGPPDGRFWDIATIHEIDAKQRKRSSAGLRDHLLGCRDGMTAIPSEAESPRSSALAQKQSRARAACSDYAIDRFIETMLRE
jgi:hypothetical protein